MNLIQGAILQAKKIAFGISEQDINAAPFISVKDCNSCATPCEDEDHPHYPSYLKINQEKQLLYSVKPYTRHVLISTSQEDWQSHIDDDKNSLAYHLSKAIDEGRRRIKADGGNDPEKVLITNSSRKPEQWEGPGWQVIILPDQIVVDNVTPEQCDDFFDAFLKSPVGSSSIHAGDSGQPETCTPIDQHQVHAGETTFIAKRWLPKAAIMICSHKRRDKRCGITAPVLRKEFMRILRSKNIYGDGEGDVEIWMISHIGGHKFAGNVIVHKSEGQAIWYGRVEPCHSQAIVEATIERGEIIREIYRGSMNGSFDGQKKLVW
ncbi:hypothetical protein BGZ76_001626 [Entomortierella beljakovae]|nr:hypothetical protein BGZ76_001626 [Entomortierella beljakovae]